MITSITWILVWVSHREVTALMGHKYSARGRGEATVSRGTDRGDGVEANARLTGLVPCPSPGLLPDLVSLGQAGTCGRPHGAPSRAFSPHMVPYGTHVVFRPRVVVCLAPHVVVKATVARTTLPAICNIANMMERSDCRNGKHWPREDWEGGSETLHFIKVCPKWIKSSL